MNMSDELERLSKLHKDGTLNDDEFAKAKSRLLRQENEPIIPRDDSLREAANRFVSMQVVVSIIGATLFLILLFGVILPRAHFHRHFYP
jgi:hypothetical protein